MACHPGAGLFQATVHFSRNPNATQVTSKSSDTQISQESGPTSRKTRRLWDHPGAGVDLRRRLLEPCGGNIDKGGAGPGYYSEDRGEYEIKE